LLLDTLLWTESYHGQKVTMDRKLPWTESYHGQKVTMDRKLPWTESYHGQKVTMDRKLLWLRKLLWTESPQFPCNFPESLFSTEKVTEIDFSIAHGFYFCFQPMRKDAAVVQLLGTHVPSL
jgi:hypothetical protein